MADVFQRCRTEGRAALIGYLPAGFPDVPGSTRLLRAMVAGGADIVEVGLPYSDPLMDGPVICSAAETALRSGTTTDDVLRVVADVADGPAAVVVMSYWNPIDRYGVLRFAERLRECGGQGTITPDLTPEEGSDWLAACDRTELDHIFLAAPSSTDQRLARVASASSGFVYAASLMGVTGARTRVSGAAEVLVGRLRAVTKLPVAVGLGVSTARQASDVARYADGVIVGSAFVKLVADSRSVSDAESAVGDLARELSLAVRRRIN